LASVQIDPSETLVGGNFKVPVPATIKVRETTSEDGVKEQLACLPSDPDACLVFAPNSPWITQPPRRPGSLYEAIKESTGVVDRNLIVKGNSPIVVVAAGHGDGPKGLTPLVVYGVEGIDIRGERPNQSHWRALGEQKDFVSYGFSGGSVSPETAEIFDELLESLCFDDGSDWP